MYFWARHMFIAIDAENNFRAQGFQTVGKVDGFFWIRVVVHFLRNEDCMAPERHNFRRVKFSLISCVHGMVTCSISVQLCLQRQTQLQVCSSSCKRHFF